MFEQIFIEKAVRNNLYAIRLKNFFHSPNIPVRYIDKVEQVFGVVKKNYLEKRRALQLFIGEKKGDLIKRAPAAYGTQNGDHYYFVHAYNCPYECEYCYLQGYFNSPDLVLFVNHDEIIEAMRQKISQAQQNDKNAIVWFHAGEFSDSLALSHITQEWSNYWNFFRSHPSAYLELRTKSINIDVIKNLEPLSNVCVSFSLAPHSHVKQYDKKTPSLNARLQAMKTLIDKGFNLGVHLDPIIINNEAQDTIQYQQLAHQLQEIFLSNGKSSALSYLSLGTLRFSKQVYAEVKKNYPHTNFLHSELIKSDGGKVSYPLILRRRWQGIVKKILIQAGFNEDVMYHCMETF